MQDKLNEIINAVNEQGRAIVQLVNAIQRQDVRIRLLAQLTGSNSQFMQDIFVLSQTGYKKGGYFVEFGGCDGKLFSNTYLLEKDYGWSGIVSEPARCWAEKLRANRGCNVDTRCVWEKSGALLQFTEAQAAEISTLSEFVEKDMHAQARRDGKETEYEVETVSLTDLLKFYEAPSFIDYLSIDTEGSELRILSNFDFEAYRVGIITVEHNWTEDRQRIFSLLQSHGYKRVHTDLTDCDDWYILDSM